MLLIQRLSTLDCHGACLSPPGLGVHYAARLPARLSSPGTRRHAPTGWLQRWLHPHRGELPRRPWPRRVAPGRGTHDHVGDGCTRHRLLPYLSFTYTVISGPASHRLSPSGRLAGGCHLLPCSEAGSSPACCPVSLLGTGFTGSSCHCRMRVRSLGKMGLRARRKHPGEGVAWGEWRGQPAPTGQDATAGGAPNPGADRREGEDAALVQG